MVKKAGFRIQVSGFTSLIFALLLVTCHSSLVTAFGQSQPQRWANVNNIRFADQFPGSNGPAKIDAALADIGAGPGTLIIPPGVSAGNPSFFPNNVGILDFRQSYDVIGGWDRDPDRAPLLLLENRLGELTTKPVTGTVTLTNGSAAVTGTGTQFIAQFQDRLNRAIKLNSDPESAWGRVVNVQSDTQMTLASGYTGTGGSGPASYFITQLGLVINNLLEGGNPSEGHGEGVGLTSIGWRKSGTRGVFGANFNVGYYTRAPLAPAVGLELDLSNYTADHDALGVDHNEALRIVSAGLKRAAVGTRIMKIFDGGEFVRGLWIDNSYTEHGIHVQGPSNHLYLVPTADNGNPMLVGRNAADAASKWAINNDGSSQFNTLTAGPASASFGSLLRGYIDAAGNRAGILNPTAGQVSGFAGVNQSSGATDQVGVTGLSAAEHPSGTKNYVAGVDGEAFHEAAGTVSLLTGVGGYASASAGAGAVTKMASLYAWQNTRDSGTVTDNYGLYVDPQTAGTNNYAVYTAGTTPSRFGGAISSGLNAVTFSATPTFDAALGNTQKITLEGNVTSSTLSNAAAGEALYFIICQNGSGNHTFAWPPNMRGGMTIGSTASKCSAQSFIFDGTTAYALSAGITNM
ncbi:MAG: hypothetical protein ACE145_07800 [Terriglobia bacterium]